MDDSGDDYVGWKDLPCESFEFIDSEQYMCCSTVGSMNLSFLMLEMGLATWK
jgi:hypothetical protein